MTPTAEVLHAGDLDVNVRISQRRTSIRLTVERDASLTAVIPPGADEADLVNAIKAKRQSIFEPELSSNFPGLPEMMHIRWLDRSCVARSKLRLGTYVSIVDLTSSARSADRVRMFYASIA